jgi:hypothetical protein
VRTRGRTGRRRGSGGEASQTVFACSQKPSSQRNRHFAFDSISFSSAPPLSLVPALPLPPLPSPATIEHGRIGLLIFVARMIRCGKCADCAVVVHAHMAGGGRKEGWVGWQLVEMGGGEVEAEIKPMAFFSPLFASGCAKLFIFVIDSGGRGRVSVRQKKIDSTFSLHTYLCQGGGCLPSSLLAAGGVGDAAAAATAVG